MKTKASIKKKNENKELEAQKQAIEELKRKEQEKQQEEQRRLELVVTEWCVEQIWQERAPKDFMIDFISQYLRKHKLLEHFESLEIQTTAEFLIYVMIFGKEQLRLDTHRTVLVANICWKVLRQDNCRYDKMVQPGTKTMENDWIHFRQLVHSHFVQDKYFSRPEIQALVEYFSQLYFQNHRLFSFVFNNHQQREEINISIFVDQPLEVLPLSQALYMGKKKIEVRLEDSENEEEEEQQTKQEDNQQDHPQEQQSSVPQEEQIEQAFIERQLLQVEQQHREAIRDHDEQLDRLIKK